MTSTSQPLLKKERKALKQTLTGDKEDKMVQSITQKRKKTYLALNADNYHSFIVLFNLFLIKKAGEELKRQIQEADLSLKNNQALTDLELEAKEHAQRLVERADPLRMQQEDELGQLNQVGCKRGHLDDPVNVFTRVRARVYLCVCMILSAHSGCSGSSHS